MRYLIISDLHSNWEALEAVLECARDQYDEIICCGDLAGYGPDPNRMLEWCRENLAVVIRGNHDRACAGLDDLEWFNPVAKEATLWTISQLTQENRDYLAGLQTGPVNIADFQLVHGSPLDEDEYVISLADASNLFSYLETNLVFFGHTHLQCGFAWKDGKRFAMGHPGRAENEGRIQLDTEGAYLINPGSVGQPRDGDPRAGFAFYNTDTKQVIQRRADYNYRLTQEKIVAAGLPELLAVRLAYGR